jgi:nitrogenase molybdenum-iron protein alpha/beta subunit
MKDIRMVLPNLASDTAGAASALFALDGLTVIHDAAGSMESYITFDESRELDGKRTVASRLSRLEAITGDDGILLDKLAEECASDAPPFIAVLGSPIPFTIGTDLDGIAAEAEFASGVPAFAVNTGGFESYDKGAGEALRKVIEKTAKAPAPHDGTIMNLLGAIPMDYSDAEIDGIQKNLLAEGVDTVRTLTLADGMEETYHAADADRNLVISLAGLPAARYMERKYGIPYTVGVPVGMPVGDGVAAAMETDARKVLVLGESVLTKQLVLLLREAGIDAVAGVTANDDPAVFPDVPALRLDTEAGIRAELKKNYFAVVGDPLYKLLLPRNSVTKFIDRPHRALSGRLYPAVSLTIDQLLMKMKEVLA